MIVRQLPLSLLLTSGLLAASACGGDDGDGTGNDTDATTGTPTTMTAATMSETTEDPTVEPDTTVDPSDPTGETTEDPTTDPDTSTGDVPGAVTAFRLNSVAVRDPHLFAQIIPIGDPTDITESQVNEPLTAALNMDGEGDSPPDGFYDLGFALLLQPLDQTDGGTGGLVFANAQCAAGDAPSECSLLATTVEYPSTFTSQVQGLCQEANPANLTNYDPAPGSTSGPCFVSAGAAVTIATSSFALPLENATVAARYVGDPAGNLVEGTLIGWVSIAAAESAVLAEDLPVVGGEPLSEILLESDRDDGGTGWWFHIDFTAVPATWSE